MSTTLDRARTIIAEQLGTSEDEAKPTASFIEDLACDSLDIVELAMAFEDTFDIEVPDEEAEKIKTVQDAVDYIDRAVAARKSATP
jgi:acyl carrier protein